MFYNIIFGRFATVDQETISRCIAIMDRADPTLIWGGDCESTYEVMAETLREGLSLTSTGFAFWLHVIGGFEGKPPAGVFERWLAFGLFSSHSRLYGSNSYRVPWLYDEEGSDEASRVCSNDLQRRHPRIPVREDAQPDRILPLGCSKHAFHPVPWCRTGWDAVAAAAVRRCGDHGLVRGKRG
jgi:hypothetical protein